MYKLAELCTIAREKLQIQNHARKTAYVHRKYDRRERKPKKSCLFHLLCLCPNMRKKESEEKKKKEKVG